jgi:SAM-dependent methyltransferase
MALLSRCAGRLADVLTGRQAPLGLLFPDGDAALVNRVYADTAATRAFNAAVADAAVAVVGARPAPTRVLEIGAGSGGTTAAVLPRLPAGHVRYVFTDLGAGFLPAARAKFADFPFIDYRPLDIEQPPASQGFETGAYDLVLAANVLHATRDLAETAGHAASLLAPGGVLLLLEAVRPLAWVDLTFGLTTGWWRFQDTALRPDHPLIDAGQWRALLADLGLAGATSIVHPGSELGIIIATRPQP